jgi:membrane protease YdiL (CAAX protease family)
MKKRLLLLGALTACFIAVDALFSTLFKASFGNPVDWSDANKVARTLVNGLLIYPYYLCFLRIWRAEKLPAIAIRPVLIQTMVGLGLAVSIAVICLILTPEFYGPKSGFNWIPLPQIVGPFVFFFGAAVLEEVLNRGFVQRALSKFLPFYLAVPIQIAFFVAGHKESIILHSDPALRIAILATFGLVVTMMANRSIYLILPIAFHIGSNFFEGLVMGHHTNGFSIPGMWVYQDYLRLWPLPILYLLICAGMWWQNRRNATGLGGATGQN